MGSSTADISTGSTMKIDGEEINVRGKVEVHKLILWYFRDDIPETETREISCN